jgi:glycosyltransferase involved in cell wall biosynthesis
MGTPVPVLLMVRELGIGGCERDLTKLALQLDRSRFTPIAGCFRQEGIRAGELRAAGVRIVEFPVRSFASLGTLRHAWDFWRFLRRERIQVVHCFDVPTITFGVPLARLAGVPAVLACRLWNRLSIPPRDFQLSRLAEQRAHRVVVNAQTTGNEVAADGIPKERIFLSYNGVDTKIFHPRDRKRVAPMEGAELVIGSVCALRQEKRLDLLIDAFALLRRPGMRLLIVGSGPKEAEYKALVSKHGMEADCHFEPMRNDVAGWMRSMDVFVLSSETESFPNGLLEAMACGCAVVGSAVGGVPEMITPESGLLFEPSNRGAAALAEQLQRLVDQPAVRATLGAQAAQRAEQVFSMEIAARRTEAFYTSLLAH